MATIMMIMIKIIIDNGDDYDNDENHYGHRLHNIILDIPEHQCEN